MMNHEGYADPTADKAISKASQTPLEIMKVINLMKQFADACGLEVIGRIQVRDKATGKEWR